MTERVEQQICIKLCVKLEHSSEETIWMIQQAFGGDTMSTMQIKVCCGTNTLKVVKNLLKPWLVWLSGLSTGLWTKKKKKKNLLKVIYILEGLQ